MTDQTRAELLGIEPGDVVTVLGHSDEENALLDPIPDIEIIDLREQDTESDEDEDGGEIEFRYPDDEDDREPAVAIVVVDDSISLPDDLDEALPRVSGVDRVWIAMPQRTRGVDPAAVETIVTDYGWVAGERVDLDDAWIAVRVELS